MIKVFSALALPSMSQFDHLYDAFRTPQYDVFGYLSNSKGDINNITGILTRLQLLKILVANGEVPFYGSDLFGASCSLGGWMNGLSVWGIIKETGNVREVMVEIGDDLFRKYYIKEWELAIPADLLSLFVNEFRTLLLENI
jgi:hypothetical protein